jgi:hypothetical protein
MTESDLTLLREHGFPADVLTTLTHLGYNLASHDPVTENAEFFIMHPIAHHTHGFTLHRQDTPSAITNAIFTAGVLNHQKQTRDAFQSLLTAAGLRL